MSEPALSPEAADRFDHPHPATEPAELSLLERVQFHRLSLIEEVSYRPQQVSLGKVVGVVLLRQRFKDGAPCGVVAEELPCFGVVVQVAGHVGWLVEGLEKLDAVGLEMFSRKTLELFRSVTIESVRRQGAANG